MKCLARHTKYQPSKKEWKCPNCGVGHEYIDTVGHKEEGLIIEDPDGYAYENCTHLHDEDLIKCHSCNKYWSGAALSRIMAKKANIVTCPTCHGKGMVKKS